MGTQNIATVSWGFTLSHEEVLLAIEAIEKKRKAEGKKLMYEDEKKEITYEYIEDIFSVPTTKFAISLDIDEEMAVTVSIFYTNGLGTAERWGRDSGMCATGLGTEGLDAKLDTIKADGSKELQNIRNQLLLKEAGIAVQEQCLLVMETI